VSKWKPKTKPWPYLVDKEWESKCKLKIMNEDDITFLTQQIHEYMIQKEKGKKNQGGENHL